MVRHHAEGMDAKMVSFRGSSQTSNQFLRVPTVKKNRAARFATKSDEEPSASSIVNWIEADVLSAKFHNAKTPL
jgi:hypothetical protein